ncbi:MAG TPA: hypothetical protein EYO73_09690 [Sulfurimonas sp.]|nr:hypothetical protein [Sulfurimonas sp.]
MKNIIKMMLVAAITTMFMACGGGSSSESVNSISTTTPMVIGEPVALYAGYSIVDSSLDAVVDIIVAGTLRTATLTAGSASIKRP